MKLISLISVILSSIGAINWGLVGAFNFNLVAAIFGPDTTITKVIYSLVGIAGLLLLLSIKHIIHPGHNFPRA